MQIEEGLIIMRRYNYLFPQYDLDRNIVSQYEHIQNQNLHVNSAIIENEPLSLPTSYKKKSSKHKAPFNGCQHCGTGSTPEWRKGPDGNSTLCNACGLRYAKSLKKGQAKASLTRPYKMQLSFILNPVPESVKVEHAMALPLQVELNNLPSPIHRYKS